MSLLIEVLCEEIPARMQEKGASAFFDCLINQFKEHGIVDVKGSFYSGPRRLAVHFHNLPKVTADRLMEHRGPRVDSPPKALQGFLATHTINESDCTVRETPKGSFYFYDQIKKGESMETLIPQFVDKALKSIPWPVFMNWGQGTIPWVRPIHSILCLWHNKPLLFTLSFGQEPHVPLVETAATTLGHRFLSEGPIAVQAHSYKDILEKAHVMVDHRARKAKIWRDIEALAREIGGHVVEDSHLLDEVTGLVEWPVVMMGCIDPAFMALPRAVLITAMRVHQRYFAVHHESGDLMPVFIFVSNMLAKDGGKKIIQGNERVLKARLSDALFFYTQDCKIPLETQKNKLEKIIFHEKLGTLAHKTHYMQKLSQTLAMDFGCDVDVASQTASLLKADLVTGMVGEFPELQGIMGADYARHQGYGDDMAKAIEEHYLPKTVQDVCPTSDLGSFMAVIEKLVHCVGFFGMNIQPTSSKDPFALRRALLGLVRIMEHRIPLTFKTLITKTYHVYEGSLERSLEDTLTALMVFLKDRLKIYWQGKGHRTDAVMAVLDYISEEPLVHVKNRLICLERILEHKNSQDLIDAHKRISNILGPWHEKKIHHGDIVASNLTCKAEKNLYEKLITIEATLKKTLKQQDFLKAFDLLQDFKNPLHDFFQNVLVNDTNTLLQYNRLALLQRIKNCFDFVVHFAHLESHLF